MTFEDSLAWARAAGRRRRAGALRGNSSFRSPGPLYFAGHSLGLQPRRAREYVLQEMDDWARFGVEGHFGRATLGSATTSFSPPTRAAGRGAAARSGGDEHPVVNLHLMMVSFYRPRPGKHRLLIEKGAFPPTSTP